MNTPRLFIVEGCDGSGKSSFINEIFNYQKYPKYEIIHNGVYKDREDAFHNYNTQVDDNEYHGVVLDRSYISELIYGKVLRGEDNSKYKVDIQSLEDIMRLNFRPIVILCNPPIENVLNTWRSRIDEEHVKDESKIISIYEQYQLIDSFTSLKVIDFDYTDIKRGYINIMKELVK